MKRRFRAEGRSLDLRARARESCDSQESQEVMYSFPLPRQSPTHVSAQSGGGWSPPPTEEVPTDINGPHYFPTAEAAPATPAADPEMSPNAETGGWWLTCSPRNWNWQGSPLFDVYSYVSPSRGLKGLRTRLNEEE